MALFSQDQLEAPPPAWPEVQHLLTSSKMIDPAESLKSEMGAEQKVSFVGVSAGVGLGQAGCEFDTMDVRFRLRTLL